MSDDSRNVSRKPAATDGVMHAIQSCSEVASWGDRTSGGDHKEKLRGLAQETLDHGYTVYMCVCVCVCVT